MVKHLGYEENSIIICISRRNTDSLHRKEANYKQGYETGTDIDAGVGQSVPAER